MKALICCAVNFLSSILTFQSVPIWRLTERIVRSTLVTACRFATSPTSTSPFLAKATTDGVVRDPSAFAMTVGSPPSRTATTELVVPRSMPTARAMCCPLSNRWSKLSLTGASLPGPQSLGKLLESYWLNFSARRYIPAARVAPVITAGPRGGVRWQPQHAESCATRGGPRGRAHHYRAGPDRGRVRDRGVAAVVAVP